MSNELITALGVLGGALIGIIGSLITTFLSNRHTRKLELLKINEERRKEKLKREISIIEDVYQMLIRVDDLCQEIVSDTKFSLLTEDDTIRRIKEIKSISSKISTLVNLNLCDLKREIKEYISSLRGYLDTSINLKHGLLEEMYVSDFKTLQAKLEELMEKVTSRVP